MLALHPDCPAHGSFHTITHHILLQTQHLKALGPSYWPLTCTKHYSSAVHLLASTEVQRGGIACNYREVLTMHSFTVVFKTIALTWGYREKESDNLKDAGSSLLYCPNFWHCWKKTGKKEWLVSPRKVPDQRTTSHEFRQAYLRHEGQTNQQVLSKTQNLTTRVQ